MDIAEQIARYLASSGFGAFGSDIFVSELPENDNCIGVIRSGGELADYLPVEKSLVDVYVKNTSSLSAVTLIESIKRQIHRMHSWESPSIYIYSMLVVQDVEDLTRDNEQAKVYKISIQVLHRAKILIS